MILVITNKVDTTADLLIVRAAERGLPIIRLNTEDLPKTEWEINPLAPRILLRCGARTVSSSEITGIWYRRPVTPEFPNALTLTSAERRFLAEQWRATIDALEALPGIRWVSRPSSILQAENKVLQLRLAQEVGFSVPATCVTNSSGAFASFCGSEGKVVTKALAGGHIDDEPGRFVFTSPVCSRKVPTAEELAASPVVLQRRLHPDAHLRITVVGDQVLPAQVVPAEGAELLDWRTSQTPPTVRAARIPDALAVTATALVRAAGVAFASMDVLAIEGQYFFLDLNPNGEWGWLERGAGLRITDALLDTLLGED